MGRPIKRKFFTAKYGSHEGNLQILTNMGVETVHRQKGTGVYDVDSGRYKLVDKTGGLDDGEASLQHDDGSGMRTVWKLNQYRVYYFDRDGEVDNAVWRDNDGNLVGTFDPPFAAEETNEPGGPDYPPETATATATVADGSVQSITVTDGGNGYQSAPTVTISAPDGTDAVLGTVTVDTGVVTDIELVDGGSGYASVPAITITGANTTPASATAVLTDGVVTSINITDGGTGYTTATADIDPVNKVQATATATLTGDEVTSIAVDTAGEGYASATVTIDAP